MITIYTIAYNEELLMPFFIKWYRDRFPDCKIVVYDNESTDSTVKIALENNCEVISYSTNNQLSDSKYLEIKNNCWKNADTDWVLVCDVDECLDIKQQDLLSEDERKVSLVLSKGYNMYNLFGSESIETMIYGVRASQYDKYYLFNKRFIKDINYAAGCHTANVKGRVRKSKNVYNLYHFCYISEDYILKKYKRNVSRMSDENKKKGWGIHYNEGEKTIRDKFKTALNYFLTHKEKLNPEEAIIWKK